MNKKVLNYIEECESWKVAIKNLHWSANNMSQHELCDDIASSISDFEDLVSEVEQSITGKIKLNGFTPKNYEIKSLKGFVEDVISSSQSFLKELEGMGDKYVGIKSECETFIGDMQRKLYLVNFTLKEELKQRLKAKINESMPKNLANHDEVDKFMGRKPKSIKARINQIYRIVKKYGIDSKVYHDENWQAISDYYRAISSLGCEVEMKPCGHISNIDSMQSDGGYCDYAEDGMPRSKQYAIKIMFEDGMAIDGYIKCMAAGTVSYPFSRYDTCIVLWPKSNRMIENRKMRNESINEYGDTPEVRKKMGRAALRGILKGDVKPYQNAINSLNKRKSKKEDYKDFQDGFENENRQIKLSEAELKQVVKEASMKLIKEWGFPDEGFGDDYNTPYGDIDDPRSDYPIGKEGDVEYSWDEDAYLHDETPLRMQNRHDNMNSLAIRRNKENNWAKGELKNRDRMMGKYINGQADADDVGDAWDDLHYESKKPMKVTESELKQVVKEAAMNLIKEYYTVRSMHGKRKMKSGNPIKDKEIIDAERNAKMAKAVGKQVQEEGSDSGIHIKPENKGKFTATKKATGKSTEELTHSKNPLTRKRAVFAQNAKKWAKK